MMSAKKSCAKARPDDFFHVYFLCMAGPPDALSFVLSFVCVVVVWTTSFLGGGNCPPTNT